MHRREQAVAVELGESWKQPDGTGSVQSRFLDVLFTLLHLSRLVFTGKIVLNT